jgi:hypothetical protein
MTALINLAGQRFGRLVVIERAESVKGQTRWHCVCDCGGITQSTAGNLRSGSALSCGCIQRESAARLCRDRETTHGGSKTRLYKIWANMHYRCATETAPAFKWYGGKGVTVCDAWLTFAAFRSWALANGYAENLSIDRVDSARGYQPDNCQWITVSENTARMQASKRASKAWARP